MNKNRNLAVIILTKDDTFYIGKKYLPKVCHKVGDRTMLEIAITTALKLDPKLIILICNRQNIRVINKLMRDKKYAEMLSIHIDNHDLGPIVSKRCYSGKDVLVMPGYSPLLTEETLKKLINTYNPFIKITNKLFFLRHSHLDYINSLEYINFDDSIQTTPQEITEVNTHQDLEIVNKLIGKKNKRKGSFGRKSFTKR